MKEMTYGKRQVQGRNTYCKQECCNWTLCLVEDRGEESENDLSTNGIDEKA